MTRGGTAPVRWIAREPPLAPMAVCARGDVAIALAAACLERDVTGLRGVAGADEALLVLIGPPDALPWVDGCAYLGRDPDAPGLLLPTTERPDAPLPLYARAVLARAGEGAAPIAVLRGPARLVPLGGARPLDRGLLRAWLDRAAAPRARMAR